MTTAYGPVLRKQIKMKSTSKLVHTLGFLGDYLCKLYVMLLMMTMNGQVLVAIALGMAVGCSVFATYGEHIRKKLFKE